jgi:hypothetical protein
MASKAHLCGGGGGLARMVGLGGTLGDYRGGVFAQSIRHQKFQLSGFIPP